MTTYQINEKIRAVFHKHRIRRGPGVEEFWLAVDRVREKSKADARKLTQLSDKWEESISAPGNTYIWLITFMEKGHKKPTVIQQGFTAKTKAESKKLLWDFIRTHKRPDLPLRAFKVRLK